MRLLANLAASLVLASALPGIAIAQCGGDFGSFVSGLKAEARQKGYDAGTVDAFFQSVRRDPKVINADRAQGVFQKPFVEFSRRLISQNRINRGQQMSRQYDSTFDRIEQTYGVPRGVLLAFWAFETDYGAFQGDFNTLNALVTLSHDCRRPELFRPQIFSALELYTHGDFSPTGTTGAWAGEVGMVQMLPGDIIEYGIDGDGDGHVNLKGSAPDALLSGGNMLHGMGWQPGQPWLQEVTVPANLDWSLTGTGKKRAVSDWAAMGVQPRSGSLDTGLLASLLLPQGRGGPAFLAYPNFDVYFEWNQSYVYVLTAAYFATRLSGAPVYDAGTNDPGLSDSQMRALQQKLVARGYDVGKVDGILGANTRDAVQQVQQQLGLPADAWPTTDLLNRL
ncbi:lytic murein transglycosylase [Chachezhania antarctica]|uniref:lytic murein transglycosylase n=1 Tax=Chachezhania antarctica TaxID=2340860 RepID=UPI000EAF3312|nr:lytic murein transglycosylase [Chachezhania antarctica]